MVTWESVQKENVLGRQEKQRKDSPDELLRKTAQRCAHGDESRASLVTGLREHSRTCVRGSAREVCPRVGASSVCWVIPTLSSMQSPGLSLTHAGWTSWPSTWVD